MKKGGTGMRAEYGDPRQKYNAACWTCGKRWLDPEGSTVWIEPKRCPKCVATGQERDKCGTLPETKRAKAGIQC